MTANEIQLLCESVGVVPLLSYGKLEDDIRYSRLMRWEEFYDGPSVPEPLKTFMRIFMRKAWRALCKWAKKHDVEHWLGLACGKTRLQSNVELKKAMIDEGHPKIADRIFKAVDAHSADDGASYEWGGGWLVPTLKARYSMEDWDRF